MTRVARTARTRTHASTAMPDERIERAIDFLFDQTASILPQTCHSIAARPPPRRRAASLAGQHEDVAAMRQRLDRRARATVKTPAARRPRGTRYRGSCSLLEGRQIRR